MDYSNFEYSFNHFSISKATLLRLVWADSILNSANPVSFIFKDTFIKFKVDKTLIRETYTISIVFIANSLIIIKFVSKFPTSHPIYFSINNRQDLVITDFLNPKSFINKITPENI